MMEKNAEQAITLLQEFIATQSFSKEEDPTAILLVNQ